MRREAVLEALGEEHRAPALAVVAPELEVVFLAGHTGHDVANAAPRIETVVESPQLRLTWLEREEPERSAEHPAARV
jgi:hypothetical protein